MTLKLPINQQRGGAAINALVVFEIILFLLAVLVVLTQIVIPLWRGTPIFPLLGSERRLERELEKVRQQQIEEKLRRKIEQERTEQGER